APPAAPSFADAPGQEPADGLFAPSTPAQQTEAPAAPADATAPSDGATPPAPSDGIAPPAPGAGPGRGPGCGPAAIAETPTTVESTVASYRTGPAGDTDGLVLADGTVVLLPPHGDVTAERFAVGTALRVEGGRHTGPGEETHLHASTITDTVTGEVVTVGR
ncbi:hypothetical protein ACFFTK_08330, partial [Pseudonocardia petroleophila]